MNELEITLETFLDVIKYATKNDEQKTIYKKGFCREDDKCQLKK